MFSFLAAAPVAAVAAKEALAQPDGGTVLSPAYQPVVGEVRWFFSHFDTPRTLFTSCDSSHTHSITILPDPGAAHSHTFTTGYTAPAVPVTVPKQWDGKEWVSI
jgi:hypothetical protein